MATDDRPATTRYPIRLTDAQREAIGRAAATCGLSTHEWAVRVLEAEARKATHVPMIKREGRTRG